MVTGKWKQKLRKILAGSLATAMALTMLPSQMVYADTAAGQADENVTASTEGEGTTLAAGDYYIVNAVTGRYLNAGNNWQTKASALTHGQLMSISVNEDNTYAINTHYKKDGKFYLGENGFLDGSKDPTPLRIEKGENGGYTIATAASSFLTAPAKDADSTASEFKNEKTAESEWLFLNREQLIERLTNEISEENSVDVTSLVFDPDFKPYNEYFKEWHLTEGSKGNGGKSPVKGGANENVASAVNHCYEAYHIAFNLNQTIENIPNGVYELSVQGFCRKDSGDDPAVYYINGTEKELRARDTESSQPNSMAASAERFSMGEYKNDFIEATVTDHKLEIGVETAGVNNWVIWDNFTLRLKRVLTDDEAAEYDAKTGFDKDQSILGDNLGYNRVRKDLVLANTVNGISNSVVKWESSVPAAISNEGKVQEGAENDTEVTMTAKVYEQEPESDTAKPLYTWEYPVRIAKAVTVPDEGVVYNFDNETIGGAAALSDDRSALKDYKGEVKFGTGRSGSESDKALSLDGTYGLELPHYNLSANSSGWSVSMWYNPAADSEIKDNKPVVLFAGYNNPQKWIGVAGGGQDKLKVWWNPDNKVGTVLPDDNARINAVKGSWSMLTLTQSAVADGKSTVSVYVDGELYASKEYAESLMGGDNQTIYLGTNFWDASFNGLIDDVSVYNKELTAEDVGESYLSSLEEAELKSRIDTFLKGAILGENTSLDKVTKDLKLPAAYCGQSITWTNSNNKALTIADNVASVANTTGLLPEATVLTYTVHYGETVITGAYNVKTGTENAFIAGEFFDQTSEEQNAYVKAEIDKVFLNGNPSLKQISLNLKLLQEISYNGLKVAEITWASSNDEIISIGEDGIGNIVYKGNISENVTLTATVTYIDSSDDAEHKAEIEFPVKVAMPIAVTPFDIGNDLIGKDGADSAGKNKTDTIMEVGVQGTAAEGSFKCAPRIEGISLLPGDGNASDMGSSRIGYLVFNVADLVKSSDMEDVDLADFDIDTLEYATLKLNVESVHGNLNGWQMKVGLYLVDPDKVDSISNTNQSTFSAVDGAYDKDHVTWCQEWLAKTSANADITFDVKEMVKEAIINGREKIAFRLQVPSSMVTITGLGNTNSALHPSLSVQLRKALTADEKAAYDAEELKGIVPSRIDEDSALTLPTTIGEFNSNVTWTSDDAAIVLTKDEAENVYKATVTRPKDADTAVTLTASVSHDGSQAVKVPFTVTVEKFMEIAEFDGKLIADLSFDDAETGMAGKDAVSAVNGENSRYEDGVFGKALYLGSQTWLDVTKAASPDEPTSALLAGKDEITVSYYSKSNFADTTKGSWTFFAAKNGNNFNNNSDRHYLAILDAKNAIKAERYDGNNGHNFKQEELENEWRKVDLVISADKTVLYIDGEKKKETSSADNVQALSSILGKSGGVLYIGKATWGSGEYYDGLLDEYKIYDKALTEEEVGRLYAYDQQLVIANAKLAAALNALSKPVINPEDDTISLKTEDAENECTITWSAEENSAITIRADGKTADVKRGDTDVYVKLTATITFKNGLVEKSIEKVFDIHVPKKGGVTDGELAKQRIQEAADALTTPVIGADDTISLVTEDVERQCDIKWAVLEGSAIELASDGKSAKVTRGKEETTVKLGATVSGKAYKDITVTRDFTITIPAKEITAQERVSEAKEALEAPVIGEDDTITFTTSSSNGCTIAWSSDNDAIKVADDGKKATVTRGDAPVEVTLTATITDGTDKTVSDTKTFKITVPKKEAGSTVDKELEAAKEALAADVEAAEAKLKGNKADYPADRWEALEAAVAAAKEAIANGDAKAVADAKAALEAAVSNFKTNAEIQEEEAKKAEEAAKAAAKADLTSFINTKKPTGSAADYTAESWAAYQKALSDAQAILNNANATSAQITAAKAALEKAIAGLIAVKAPAPVVKKVSKITFASKSYQIAAGKKLDLSKEITLSPKDATNKKVTYSIDKKSKTKKYAAISSKGVLTTKKAGIGKTVTVTVKSADGGASKTVKVKIMKTAVKKISFSKKTISIKAGKSKKLTVKVTPKSKTVNAKVAWKSSNTKYATVKNGKVTTKKAGKGKTVTITATATDGSKKKATIKVKITK